ncbi:MAG: FAD-dependent oxidoreductase, partial [Deltaproteobacteria bacterium]|nr:FAD-dependent oxidoreductase [Deltaproteobacteria bacterium]
RKKRPLSFSSPLSPRKKGRAVQKGRIVILGNGGAAASAAKAARTSGYRGEIHLVSDTDGPAFNPMLSPYYLNGLVSWGQCFPFGEAFYRDHDVACHFAAAAESLDTANQHVTLSTGKRLGYDKCLIATGADPVIPPVQGLKNSPRVFPLRNAASVRKLEDALGSARRVVTLGASLVGLKVAEILIKRKIDVILIDVVDQVLPRGAHPLSAALLRTYLAERGVDVRLGCAMQGMEGTPEGVACRFPGNIVEEADFVALCTGVRPNLAFVDAGQVAVDKAIVVNERMETSALNLYAAGDVSQGMNLLPGKHEWLGTWGHACRQGRIAGENMAGRYAAYPDSISENISPFFDWTYAQVGDAQPEGSDVRHLTFGDPRRGGYGILAFRRDILVGFNLINCTHLAGKLRQAVVRRRRWEANVEQPDNVVTEREIERVLTEMTDRFSQFSGPWGTVDFSRPRESTSASTV